MRVSKFILSQRCSKRVANGDLNVFLFLLNALTLTYKTFQWHFHLVPRNEYILSQCKHLVDGEY